MNITKASGEQEAFDRQKLCNSLENTGAPEDLVQRVCRVVEKKLEPGMTTKEIYDLTSTELKKQSPVLAAKYSLKQAIMDLGPAGFLFEQYIATILKEYGYETTTNQIMKGECVSHEVDVLAHTKDTHYIIEAKYHNSRGIRSDVKVAMYLFARLLDIGTHQGKKDRAEHKAWLVTNTKFTSSAVRYAKCKGMKLTGWKYPKKENLQQLIEAKALYPVTVLPSIDRYAKEEFAKHNIYFAKDLIHFTPDQFNKLFGIYSNKAKQIQAEAAVLCEQL